MSFFSSVGNFLGNLVGRDSEEEKRRKQREQQQRQQSFNQSRNNNQQAPTTFSNNNQDQNRTLNKPTEMPQNEVNLVVPSQKKNLLTDALKKPVPKTQNQAELDRLTQQNMAEAKKQREQGEGWLGRNILNKGDINKDAEVIARSRATRQFQEAKGYNKNPDVLNFSAETLRKSTQHGEDLKKSASRLDTAAKVADKAGQIAQYVPVTGSVVNLGLSAAENNARSRGNTSLADTIKRQRDMNEFGMTQDEMAKLDPEARRKLQVIREIGYAASPLDVLGLGGLAKSEGVGVAKNAAIQVAKKGAIEATTKEALQQLAKTELKKLAINTVVGTAISAAGQQYLTGEIDPLAAVKGGAMVGGTSLLIPDAPNKGGLLEKPSTIANNRNAATVTTPEVAPGVKSANPNQIPDANAQVAAQAAEEAKLAQAKIDAADLNTPAYQRKDAKNAVNNADKAASDVKATELGVGDTPLDTPTFEHRQKLQDVIRQGDDELRAYVNENPMATPQDIQVAKDSIQQQVVSRLAEVQAVRTGENAVPDVPVTPPVSQVATPPVDVPPVAAMTPPVAPVAAAAEVPIQTASVDVPTGAPTGAVPPQMPTPGPSAEMVDVAPRTHDALVKQMGPSAKERKGIFGKREKINLDDLKSNAEGVVANMDDKTLVESFQTVGADTMITDPNSFALARAALDRLSKMENDPIATQTVTNIMDAMEQQVSKSGQYLRIVQEEFDNMPLPMKVRYIIKKIDSANAKTKNYAPLRDDPAKATLVEANVTAHLVNSQNIAERVAAIEGQLSGAAEAAKNGQAPDVNIGALASQLDGERRALAASNGELAKYFTSLLPGRGIGQKAGADIPRQMMLASFTGRVNDVITTGFNVANLGAQNLTQGLISKAVNLVKPGTVTDTWKGTKALAKGTISGVKKGAGEFQGKQYAGDLHAALSNNLDPRSGLQKPTSKFGQVVQAATEFATHASGGVREQRLVQLADQEGRKLGLKGADLKAYTEARAATPSREMVNAADTLKAEVNNLNDNPISKTLNNVANSIKGDTAIGGLIKNQVMPFTSWLGGNIWNSVTDKNVVANVIKLGDSARKADPEGITRNLAKLANNAALSFGVGYGLAKSGVLVDEGPVDPSTGKAYNDAGGYIKIGDKYIPVGFLGFAAPSLILGKATHDALNNPDGGNIVQQVGDIAGKSLINLSKSINLVGALGVENNLTRAYDAATREGGNVADGAAEFAKGVAGQYIPGVFGDANAILNKTSLNPTGEAPQTKVVDPNSPTGEAKDYKKSAVASLKSRIPFLSQSMPRKPGVAAPDLIDRTTKGKSDTNESKAKTAEIKQTADQATDFESRGIPNPNKKYKDGESFEGAVKARFENGEYDKAIEGLKAKLESDKNKKDIPPSTTKKIEDQIKLYEVHKEGKYDPGFTEKYSSVSLSEWRNMGDPESDEYDPDMYKKLWDYDSSRANAGISANEDDKSKTKYSAKKPGKGRGGGGGGGGGSAASLIKGNTIGDMPGLSKVSLGDLAPQKAGSVKIPTIQQIKPGELIKKRAISVKKG